MKISSRGLDLIKRFEGFSASTYICPAGKHTIGYGHIVSPGELFTEIDRQQAEDLLIKDVHFAESVIRHNVHTDLSQSQYDALVSFVYNVGGGNFIKSTLLRLLNNKDYAGAAKQFARWVYAGGRVLPGLEKRRAAEQALFEEI